MRKIYAFTLFCLLLIISCKKENPLGGQGKGGGPDGPGSENVLVEGSGWKKVMTALAPENHLSASGSYSLISYGMHRVGNEIRLYYAGTHRDQLGNPFYTAQKASVSVNPLGGNYKQEQGAHANRQVWCFDEQPEVYGSEMYFTTISNVERVQLYIYDGQGDEIWYQDGFGNKYLRIFPDGTLSQSGLRSGISLRLPQKDISAYEHFHNMNFDKAWTVCRTNDKAFIPYVDRFGKLVISRLRDEMGFGHQDTGVFNDRYYFAPVAEITGATEASSTDVSLSSFRLADGKISVAVCVKNQFISQYLYDPGTNTISKVFERKAVSETIDRIETTPSGRLFAFTSFPLRVLTFKHGLMVPVDLGFYKSGAALEGFYVSEENLYATLVTGGGNYVSPKMFLVRKEF
jgi:hypothetical protein